MLESNDQSIDPFIKPTFEEAYDEINQIIQRRKSSWTYVSIMPWEDVSQILLIRVYNKWHTYEPAKTTKTGKPVKMEKWVNTLISNAIKNLKRDLLLRTSRPCIGGGKTNGVPCAFNMGGDSCLFTPSKTQCAECPTYAKWQKEREAQHKARSQVALENHSQEVSNIQGDFIDTNIIKCQVDAIMVKQLSQWEAKVYRLLFVKHMTPTQVSEELALSAKNRKRPLRPEEKTNYQAVLAMQREFKGMMMEILRREGHL